MRLIPTLSSAPCASPTWRNVLVKTLMTNSKYTLLHQFAYKWATKREAIGLQRAFQNSIISFCNDKQPGLRTRHCPELLVTVDDKVKGESLEKR